MRKLLQPDTEDAKMVNVNDIAINIIEEQDKANAERDHMEAKHFILQRVMRPMMARVW